LNKLKDDFDNMCENALDDAKRRQTPADTGIPTWFLALFIFFSYEKIFRILMNPWLFYPVFIPLLGIAVLFVIGLGPLILPIMRS